MAKLGLEALESVAAMFRVLGEPGRLALLQEMREGERTVGELVERTGQGQASVSKHLKLMYEAGLLGRRKEGAKVFYRVKEEMVFSLCKLVCGSLAERQHKREMVDFSI